MCSFHKTGEFGGWMKGLNDYATELGNSAFEGAAHPQSAGDFLSLMTPGGRLMAGEVSRMHDAPVTRRAV